MRHASVRYTGRHTGGIPGREEVTYPPWYTRVYTTLYICLPTHKVWYTLVYASLPYPPWCTRAICLPTYPFHCWSRYKGSREPLFSLLFRVIRLPRAFPLTRFTVGLVLGFLSSFFPFHCWASSRVPLLFPFHCWLVLASLSLFPFHCWASSASLPLSTSGLRRVLASFASQDPGLKRVLASFCLSEPMV